MKTVRLKDIARIYSGGTPPRSRPEYWNGEIPWVKTGLIQNCKIRRSNIEETITEKGLSSSSAKMIPAGSVVMAMIGQGKTRAQVGILACDACTNQNAAAIVPGKEAVADYLYQQLLFRYEYIRALSNASGQQNLNLAIIKSIRLSVPGVEEQKAIAETLGAWDHAIEVLDGLVVAKEKRLAAMIMEIIASQREKAPSHPIRSISRRIQRKPNEKDLPILTISSSAGFVRQEDKYSRYMAGESVKSYTRLKSGEFAYNKGNSLRFEFGCVFRLNNHDEALVPHVYVCFDVDKSQAVPEYLEHVFAADYLKRQLRGLVRTGVRNNGLLNIRPSEFLGATVPLPDLEIQERIARVLDAYKNEIDLLKKQAAATRRQKRGLMQKLLTGEWRVGGVVAGGFARSGTDTTDGTDAEDTTDVVTDTAESRGDRGAGNGVECRDGTLEGDL